MSRRFELLKGEIEIKVFSCSTDAQDFHYKVNVEIKNLGAARKVG